MQKDFSYPVKIAELTRNEQHYHVDADSEELEELCRILKVEDVRSFSFDIYLQHRFKEHRLDIWGSVSTVLSLQSVVSLEVFDKAYQAPFRYYYDTVATYKDLHQGDTEPDINAEVPDLIENGQIDLGSIAIEQLALVMDDYPRREGEIFRFESEFDEETTRAAHPFAALAKLKK
jgi:uncharacterized metal-binding protein YceD (DUF177 family)